MHTYAQKTFCMKTLELDVMAQAIISALRSLRQEDGLSQVQGYFGLPSEILSLKVDKNKDM